MTDFSVLFVDDEDKVLSGLRRMLRQKRDEWDMHFALSAEEALAQLENVPFDVVVSDVRMPGTDGIAFLEIVRRQYPESVRIILSGHTDHVATLRATGVAHQYLAKPCEPELLESAIRRSMALRAKLGDSRLAAAIGGPKTLPTAPRVYERLTTELAKPEPAIKAIAEVVASDPGIAAKILQVANSAFFALRNEVTSIPQAVTLLGMKTVTGLALTVGAFDSPALRPGVTPLIERIRESSLQAASVARAIAVAETGDGATGDAAFLAGILHDCGKLILALNWPSDFTGLEPNGPSLDEEQACYGIDHAAAGAFLLGVWNLPDEIVEAVAYHHRPLDSAETSRFSAGAALHVALGVMERKSGAGSCPLDEQYVEVLGKSARIPMWEEILDDYEYERLNR